MWQRRTRSLDVGSFTCICASMLSAAVGCDCCAVPPQAGNYQAHILHVDTTDSKYEYRVNVLVTNVMSHCSIEAHCEYWARAASWSVEVVAVKIEQTSTQEFDNAMSHTVADSVHIVANILTNQYAQGRIGHIGLPDDRMPDEFTGAIYDYLAAEMKRSALIAQPAYDQHLQSMLQRTFDNNRCIQLLKSRLAERGFPMPTATPRELIGVRSSLVGLSWSRIAGESRAGLNPGSASVVFVF